ncbi:MAG: Uma2 family endonuclease [Bacteroidetes bacterium]|nr:MAG: Uma2 family endonuclease [Bacteroidota bacterium]
MQNPTFTLSDYVQFCEKAGEYGNFFEFVDQQIVDRHSSQIVDTEFVNFVLNNSVHDFTDLYEIFMATSTHSIISTSFQMSLWELLNALGFMVYCENRRIYIKMNGKVRIPDVLLTQFDLEIRNEKDLLENPFLIGEVLSPSTENVDFTEKLIEYQSITSLKEYIIISQNEAKIWQHSRQENSWIETVYEGIDEILSIDFLNIAIPLAKIYKNVKF